MSWTRQKLWQDLTPYQRAAAMALMEANTTKDGRYNVDDARNVLGAIINRSERERDPLGDHVSKPIYQPTIEPTQFARLPRILKSPEFLQLADLAQRRALNIEPDWVQGATHFLAPEKQMLALREREPDKYHNWGPFPNSRGIPGRNWTGYDPATGQYKGVLFRDQSHAFLTPDAPAAPGKPGGPAVPPAPGPIQGAPPAPAVADTQPQSPGTLLPPQSTTPSLLAGIASYWQAQQEDEALSKKRSDAQLRLAEGAVPRAPSSSPMIQGPRTPRVDLRDLATMLKASGLNPDMPGALGFGMGSLGTIGKRQSNG